VKSPIPPVLVCRRPTEVYSFGQPVQMTRRDQRQGQQTAVTTAGDGSVEVEVTWDEPNAGEPAVDILAKLMISFDRHVLM